MRAIAFLLIAALIPLSSQAAEIVGDSRVSAVTVYTDRASVTRTAEIAVEPGDHVVVLSDLPAGLVPDSLRAEGVSTAGVTLGALDSKVISTAEAAAPRERELRAKLTELQDNRALVAVDQTALAARLDFMRKIGDTAASRVNEDIKSTLTLKPDEWTGAAMKVGSLMAETQKALHGINIQLRKIDEEIAAVNADLGSIQTGAKQTYTVRVPFTATAAGALTVRVQYQIYGASWQPLYDARLNMADRAVSLTQFGQVQQATGEEWNNVALTLSTAQPARGAAPPELYTFWLSILDQTPGRSGVMSDSSAMYSSVYERASAEFDATTSLKEANFDKRKQPAAPAQMAVAAISTDGYTAEYRVPGSVTVTADNAAKKVMVQKLSTKTVLVNQARPALDPNVYLFARLTLNGEAPLLPGQVNLFRDNAFIGQAFQPMLRPGEETDLAFGINDQIVMKRQVVNDKQSESGVIASMLSRQIQVDTAFQNLLKIPATIEVYEATPKSQDDRIKVALDDKFTTPGYTDDTNKITGMKKWVLRDLAPQAKQSVKLGYTVTWPKELMLQGM